MPDLEKQRLHRINKKFGRNKETYVVFTDLERTSDRTNRDDIWKVKRLSQKGTECNVSTKNKTSQSFKIERVFEQGCVLSLICSGGRKSTEEIKRKDKKCEHRILENAAGKSRGTVKRYFMTPSAKFEADLQHNLNVFNKELNRDNMKINFKIRNQWS